jgi:tRNA dimethylallyltransferase
VGGTGLYVQAVVDPLDFPPRDVTVRAALDADASDGPGLAHAYAELQRLDPVAASRVDPSNRRRIVRALEVIRVTGRPFSSFGPGLLHGGPPVVEVAMAGVWLPRPVVGERIATRVAAMLETGLLDEAAALGARGTCSRTAEQAIGYAEALAHLRGELTLDEAATTIADRTRAFARRQRMWFRRDPRVTWVAVSRNPCEALPALLARWSA